MITCKYITGNTLNFFDYQLQNPPASASFLFRAKMKDYPFEKSFYCLNSSGVDDYFQFILGMSGGTENLSGGTSGVNVHLSAGGSRRSWGCCQLCICRWAFELNMFNVQCSLFSLILHLMCLKWYILHFLEEKIYKENHILHERIELLQFYTHFQLNQILLLVFVLQYF